MTKIQPRQDRLTWDDHHMLLALITSQRSSDPNTQVGACIVNAKNRVVGLGYNGPPSGISACQIPWERSNKNPNKTKYPYIVHAETNAIFNSTTSITGCTMYVTMFPCSECSKDIIQSGIRRIIYLADPYSEEWSTKASKHMFQLVDITYRQHQWEDTKLVSSLQKILTAIQDTPGGPCLNGILHGCTRDTSESGSN